MIHELRVYSIAQLKVDTAYFMLNAVKDSDPAPDGGAYITLINDVVIYVNIDDKLFKKRMAEAAYLQFKRELHTTLMLRYYQYCAEHHARYGDELEDK
ncbi:MAG: hypothetical protein ABS951_03600 [Solibacillus sp.]